MKLRAGILRPSADRASSGFFAPGRRSSASAIIPPFILPAPSLDLCNARRAIGATLVGVARRDARDDFCGALRGGCSAGFSSPFCLRNGAGLSVRFLPFAVTLQVTPIIAIAPLLLVYLAPQTAVLVCAFLVAFFPILANARLGSRLGRSQSRAIFSRSTALRAGRLLLWLRLPAALPFILAGLRIGGGLALIGAIAGELAAGTSGGETGLAFRIIEAGYRLDIPRMFAALALVSLTGIAIFVMLSALSHLLLAPLA